jgi:hypothetical protein
LVQDRHQKPPTPADREIRHIAHPDLIAASRQGPLHTVRVLAEPSMYPGFPAINAHDARSQSTDPHQPFDSSTTDAEALDREGPMEAWTSIGPATPLKNCLHCLKEFPVLFPARTRGTLTPRVVAGPCYAKQRAQAGHAHHFPVRFDERERLALCSEQNRMAFFRFFRELRGEF